MRSNGHRHDCGECVICSECGDAAYCVSEYPIIRPCPHFEPICSECFPGTCEPCIEYAEREALL